MQELLKSAEDGAKPSEARVFLEFKYPEIKDLLKHFLTLISASLVFSVTFSEKIINFQTAGSLQHVVVIATWLMLVLALGACGLGLYTLYLAAERALSSEVFKRPEDFQTLARWSYIYQDLAGFMFGFGLCLLVVAATISSLKK